jgi:hypothetical protein
MAGIFTLVPSCGKKIDAVFDGNVEVIRRFEYLMKPFVDLMRKRFSSVPDSMTPDGLYALHLLYHRTVHPLTIGSTVTTPTLIAAWRAILIGIIDETRWTSLSAATSKLSHPGFRFILDLMDRLAGATFAIFDVSSYGPLKLPGENTLPKASSVVPMSDSTVKTVKPKVRQVEPRSVDQSSLGARTGDPSTSLDSGRRPTDEGKAAVTSQPRKVIPVRMKSDVDRVEKVVHFEPSEEDMAKTAAREVKLAAMRKGEGKGEMRSEPKMEVKEPRSDIRQETKAATEPTTLHEDVSVGEELVATKGMTYSTVGDILGLTTFVPPEGEQQ